MSILMRVQHEALSGATVLEEFVSSIQLQQLSGEETGALLYGYEMETARNWIELAHTGYFFHRAVGPTKCAENKSQSGKGAKNTIEALSGLPCFS